MTSYLYESPMQLMGYRVGKASPYSEDERRAILDEIFCAKRLPFCDDCSPAYRSGWGSPKSAKRLYRIALHIKFILDGPSGYDLRNPEIREDYINDLAWLKKTYFRKTDKIKDGDARYKCIWPLVRENSL